MPTPGGSQPRAWASVADPRIASKERRGSSYCRVVSRSVWDFWLEKRGGGEVRLEQQPGTEWVAWSPVRGFGVDTKGGPRQTREADSWLSNQRCNHVYNLLAAIPFWVKTLPSGQEVVDSERQTCYLKGEIPKNITEVGINKGTE